MAISPESLLISSVLREGKLDYAIKNNTTSELFHVNPDEWKWLENYYGKYRKTPTKAAFLSQFPGFVIKRVDDTELYVDEVKRSHGRYELTELVHEVADEIAGGNIDRALSELHSKALSIGTAMGTVKDTDIISDWKPILEAAQRRQSDYMTKGIAGVPTGFSSLDVRTGGLQEGQLWIIAARLGEGKSWFLNQMAVAAVLAGHDVHFAALEMQKDEVSFRVHNLMSKHKGDGAIFQAQGLSQGTGVDLKKYQAFLEGMSEMENKLTVSDVRGIGIGEIISQIERHRPRVYFLDYLTLAKMGGDGGWKEIGNFTKQLKDAAGRYGCTIVAAAQLNREGAGKLPPEAHTLAESDSIGQDADTVITMKKRGDRVIHSRLAKFRGGKGSYLWWNKFDPTTGDFHEVPKSEAEDLMDADAEILERNEERGGK